MKSVALLPTHGDPFMLKHLLVNYERVWRDSVDELHVLVSGQPDREVGDYMRSQVEAVGGNYAGTVETSLDHGVALRALAEHCGLPRNGVGADVFFIVEGDARVCDGQLVKVRCHQVFEDPSRVVGTPRVSMSVPLDDACRERWGLAYPTAPDGSQGYGMWPCFVFVAARTLLDGTDHNFSARGWQEGEHVYGPEVKAGTEWCADTFGSAALQLRARYDVVPEVQYKGPWGWEGWLNSGHLIPWFHIGSLSSWGDQGGFVVDGDSNQMDGRRLTEEMELMEWGHRVHWWERFVRYAGDDLPRHQENYRRNVARMREVMGVEQRFVDHWETIVDRLVSWDETC